MKTIIIFALLYVILGLFLTALSVIGLLTAFLSFVFTGTAILIVNTGERFGALFLGTCFYDFIGAFVLHWLTERS